MIGNCPECNEFIGKKSACECGYRQQSSSGRTDHQCAWENKSSDWRCRMSSTVTHNTSGKSPWYCTWHSIVLHAPEWTEDYGQFVGWRKKIEKEYPMTQWLPVEKAWRAITGNTVKVNPITIEFKDTERLSEIYRNERMV